MIILWKLILKIKPIQLMERLVIPNLHRLASSNIIIDKEEVEKIVMNVVFTMQMLDHIVCQNIATKWPFLLW